MVLVTPVLRRCASDRATEGVTQELPEKITGQLTAKSRNRHQDIVEEAQCTERPQRGAAPRPGVVHDSDETPESQFLKEFRVAKLVSPRVE